MRPRDEDCGLPEREQRRLVKKKRRRVAWHAPLQLEKKKKKTENPAR